MIDFVSLNVTPNCAYPAPYADITSISKTNPPSQLTISVDPWPEMMADEVIRVFVGTVLITTYTVSDFDPETTLSFPITEKLSRIVNLTPDASGNLKISYILDSRDVANNLSMPGYLEIAA